MKNKKSLVALVLVALMGIVGGSFAYFTNSTTLTNNFITGEYSTSVTEEFVSPSNWTPGTVTPKRVNVTNNGNVEVAIRVKYTEKWLAADGTTVLSGIRDNEQVAQFTIGTDWELATDGYYYYKGTLTEGQTSSDFISSVTFNPNFSLEDGIDIECTNTNVNGTITSGCTSLNTGYAGATYTLDITIETIQADKKWEYTPIFITVDNVKYTVALNMSWTDFVNSSYNVNDSFEVSGDNIIEKATGSLVVDSDGVAINKDDKIVLQASYLTLITFYVEDVDGSYIEYQVPKGWNWYQFANSSYNDKDIKVECASENSPVIYFTRGIIGAVSTEAIVAENYYELTNQHTGGV